MLLPGETEKLETSQHNGMTIRVFHRKENRNGMFSRRVDSGCVVVNDVDRIILENLKTGCAVSIRKEQVVIIT